MDLININAEEAGKKLSLARRYHSEILLIITFFCIFYLFKMVISMKDDFNLYIQNTQKESIEKIQENTNVLKDIKIILLQNQDIHSNEKNHLN